MTLDESRDYVKRVLRPEELLHHFLVAVGRPQDVGVGAGEVLVLADSYRQLYALAS